MSECYCKWWQVVDTNKIFMKNSMFSYSIHISLPLSVFCKTDYREQIPLNEDFLRINLMETEIRDCTMSKRSKYLQRELQLLQLQ